jgi:hypothetical protein
MALAPLAELAQSYFDLRWHLDPVAASQAGVTHYDDRFGRFASEALHPHVAALKALTRAIEDAEPTDIDGEIDRTALLNDARVVLYRCEREQVFARDPSQWLQRVIDGLSVVREPAALHGRLGDLPAFLDDARVALVDPVGLFAETALDLLPQAERMVRQAAVAGGAPADLERPALSGLRSFKAELERWTQGGPGRFAAGEDAFNFHLHYEHALRDTAPELWRYGHRLVAELEAGAAVAGIDAGDVPELALPPEASLVRRMIRAPITVDGWALYRDQRPERVLRHAVGVLLDVGLHTRGMSVAEGVELLRSHLDVERAAAESLVRRTAAAPTYALTAAVGRRELLALRDAYAGPGFHEAVRAYGALPVSLIRWGLGLGE